MGKINYLHVKDKELQSMSDEQGKNWLDKPIMLTPKTIAVGASALVVGTITGYIWLFSTFVTLASFNVHATDFSTHVEAQTVWQLRTRLEDVGDSIFELKQRMDDPGGSNKDTREFLKDLEQRQAKLKETLGCLQTQGRHCLRMDA